MPPVATGLGGWGATETKLTPRDLEGRSVAVEIRYRALGTPPEPIHSAKVHLRARRDAYRMQTVFAKPGETAIDTILLADDLVVFVESVYDDIPGLPPGTAKALMRYEGAVPKHALSAYSIVNRAKLAPSATKISVDVEFVAGAAPTFRVTAMTAS